MTWENWGRGTCWECEQQSYYLEATAGPPGLRQLQPGLCSLSDQSPPLSGPQSPLEWTGESGLMAASEHSSKVMFPGCNASRVFGVGLGVLIRIEKNEKILSGRVNLNWKYIP